MEEIKENTKKKVNLSKESKMKKITKEPKNMYGLILENLINIFEDNLVSVVLFGSRARKNYNKYSDLDLMIIVDEYKKYDLSELRKSFLKNFQKRLDIYILSKKDIVQNFRNFSPILVTLLLGKRILFDKEMFFKETFNNFIRKMIHEDVKYCEGDKIWEMKKIAQNLEYLH